MTTEHPLGTDLDARIATWIERDPDAQTRAELEALLAGDDDDARHELERRFAGRLAFGTAGLRGVIGAGPMRMNRLVVQETTAGLGNYLIDTLGRDEAASRGVVIGHDARLGSVEFARDAADVLAALGIKVHLIDGYAATPLCAFAVTDLGAAAGVMVTASHNPPEYNGYKVYWGNGAQIVPPHDIGIAAAIDLAAQAPLPLADDATRRAHVTAVGRDLVERYLAGIDALSIHDPTGRDTLTIAYTPMHGVGAALAEEVLERGGFTNVHTEPTQREPDGHFPTVRFPNPEEPGALDLVEALARRVGADIVLANDPDADRLAVSVPTPDGDYLALSGNQIGVLLGADRLEQAGSAATVATTIVSSRMLGRVAAAHGARFFETLTGFKWIANGAMERADDARPFVFGYEEAIGFTIGELVRDKDGISAVRAFAEMAAALASRGQTVLGRLESLYHQHGLFLTGQKSLMLQPDDPRPSLTQRLREAAPSEVAGRLVEAFTDLFARQRTELASDTTTEVALPRSDVLVYELAGDARVIVRPSGTEPKVKCYYEVRTTIDANESFADAEARAGAELEALIGSHQAELARL